MFSLDHYHAAHQSAVLIVRSSQGTIALTGGDRASFLHALLTNDIALLGKGQGVYAAYLTPQGRMISDMRIIETGSRMLLNVERGIAAAARRPLRQADLFRGCSGQRGRRPGAYSACTVRPLPG